MTLAEEKKTLRTALRAQYTRMPELDSRLLCQVKAHPWVQEADVILLYVSFGTEPDTRALLQWLHETGRQIALPVCEMEGMMQFYLLHDFDELWVGAFGIPEPAGRVSPVVTDRSLCIVPGLAFTADGKRLGQGGGYYDRFLAAHPKLRTMGITYQCRLRETVPCEVHDCKVDIVMTEKGCLSRPVVKTKALDDGCFFMEV